MMSFFPHQFSAPAPATAEVSFDPLFRLLEDYEKYSREAQTTRAGPTCRRQRTRQPHRQLATFKPRFDVRETEHTYELHGELPGLERENVNIEFTEPQTIVIRGRVERNYGSEANDNASTEAIAETTTDESTTIEESTAEDFTKVEKPRSNSFQATVEDDPEDENTPASTPAATPKMAVAEPQTQQAAQVQALQNEPQYRLWERSVGEFSRAFTFPVRVDHDGVTANLSNGILSVTVPKAKKPVTRRIEISA